MSAKKYEIDMSRGSIFKNTIRFSIPFMLSNLLQLLYSAADTVVVGRFSGADAMASVGTTASLINLIVNLFIGLSVGTSISISHCYGANDNDGIQRTVHTSVALAIIGGICTVIMGLLFSKPLLVLMGAPQGSVLDGAILYVRIISLGFPALLVYNFGAAILRAVGDTKRPLLILGFTGLVNVALNLIFVIPLKMSVAGVAISTVIANYISAFIILYVLTSSDAVYKLFINKLKIYKDKLFDIFKIGIPAGLQSSLFSLSNVVIQSAINSFGPAAIAGDTAASSLEGFSYTAMYAFNQSTITSVSQNYGAKKEERIYKSILTSICCTVPTGLLIGIIILIFGEPLLGLYITDSPEAIAIGMQRLALFAFTYFLCGIMETLAGALRGINYPSLPLIFSLIGVCGFRFLWVFALLPLNRRIMFLYISWPISWTLVIAADIIAFLIVRKRAIRKMYEL